MTDNSGQFVWSEKYRPHKVADCILPVAMKTVFQQFVDKGELPNFLLVGPPGTGKTTVGKAMLDELDCDYITVAASLSGGIETLRTSIQNFASSVSFKGGRKYVILDEADYLTYATQPALRNFVDIYTENCGFIMTANYKNKIIAPLRDSRFVVVDFIIPKDEKAKLATQFMKRVIEILKLEGIEKYDQSAIAQLISKCFPDWRRTLNELQRYSAGGTIDAGIIHHLKVSSIAEIIGFMKDKNFTKVRQWAADNVGTLDDSVFYRELYENANEYFKPSYIPQLVLLLAKYEYQSNFTFSKEINFSAFCVECMIEAEWV